jgi:hypothetical protein
LDFLVSKDFGFSKKSFLIEKNTKKVPNFLTFPGEPVFPNKKWLGRKLCTLLLKVPNSKQRPFLTAYSDAKIEFLTSKKRR